MNKYLALVVIPVLASCTSSQVAQRPSRDAAYVIACADAWAGIAR